MFVCCICVGSALRFSLGFISVWWLIDCSWFAPGGLGLLACLVCLICGVVCDNALVLGSCGVILVAFWVFRCCSFGVCFVVSLGLGGLG